MTARYELRIELALMVSALLHLAAFGAWQFRHDLVRVPVLWPFVQLLSRQDRPMSPSPTLPTITFIEANEPEIKKPKPQVFVETDNRQVTGEKPKDTQYYSDRDTVAANPQNPTSNKADTPYVPGEDPRLLSTETVLKPSPPSVAAPVLPMVAPPAIAPPMRPREPETIAVEPPMPLAETGLKIYKEAKLTDPVPSLAPAPAKPTMPASAPSATPATDSAAREIVSAKAKLTTGGVSRTGIAAFNVAASPFGEYDKKIVRAVQSRWYALIERYGIYERAGTVTIHFDLREDGSVHNLSVMENTAGEILALYCQKAILDSSPFDPFPDHLRVLVGKEPREVDFTFYY